MDKQFCKRCDFPDESLPKCVATKIATKISLDDFIDGSYTPETLYPICNKNAQRLNEKQLLITDDCNLCYLCYVACPETDCSNSLILKGANDNILKNLNLTNIVLKYLLDVPTASEVKAEGNSRQKRIDLVIKNNENIYLIKVLNSLDRLSYYSRSYKEVIEKYKGKYTNNNFLIAFLIPSKMYKEGLEEKCFTFESLYNEIKGE